MAKTFFRVPKTAINVPINKLRKNLLESKKMQLLSRFWTNSLCHFFGVEVWPSCQNCNLPLLGNIWRNFFSKLCTLFQTCLDFEPKKALVEKFPSGLSQLPSARHSNNLKKNHFFFYINFCFPFVLGIWATSSSFIKKFSQVCQKCILRAQMKKFSGINFWKKVIFL